MADFKTHITASTILGVGYGTVAHIQFGVPLGHCMIAGALCSVAGMLPDLDSKSGIPQREMLSFVSVLVPMLMMFRFQELGLSGEQMVFVAGVSYVIIRFGIGAIFRKFTKHRGMWHSIPAAAIAAMATWLICLSPENGIRLFKAWAVFIGFILHLLLDEMYSVDLMGRRLKKSWGTALKFFGKDASANIFTYGKAIILAGMIFGDGTFMDCCRHTFDSTAGIERHDHDHDHYQSPISEETVDFIRGAFNITPGGDIDR
jgi:membrane-bound metal-dependent hydrolase YbcI (DUF457 family)